MYLIILCALFAVLLLVIVIWLAYAISAAYQQTIILELPFEETYRYSPMININQKYKVDKIKLTVSGTMKKGFMGNKNSFSLILASRVKNIIRENIILPYKGSIILHENDMFLVSDDLLEINDIEKLKRVPIGKSPNLETLSVIFFNKLQPLLNKIGVRLSSVKLISGSLKAVHSRHKISDFTI